jgi:murein DD-endopeptidase MepM/ murein hydrolase activator NlpD
LLLAFAGVRAAFSASRAPEPEELEPALAFPAFAAMLPDRAADGDLIGLQNLRFIISDELDERSDGEDEVEPATAPKWTENEEAEEAPARPPAPRALTVRSHKVRRGESLGALAHRYGISPETIRSYNALEKTTITPGMKILIPSRDGLRVKMARGVTLGDLARQHRVRLSDIVDANSLSNPDAVKAGGWVFLPGARAPRPGTRPRNSEAGKKAVGNRTWSNAFQWPVAGGRLSSYFGYRRHPINHRILFHRGIDIAAPSGSNVSAVKGGVIAFSGRRGGYGYVVDVRHPDGTTTRYAHNSKLLVRSGQKVRAGQSIAKVGSTGHSTGPHVHLEVIRRNERIDPLRYFARR